MTYLLIFMTFSISVFAEERDPGVTEATYCIHCSASDFDLSTLTGSEVPDLVNLQAPKDETRRLFTESDSEEFERLELCQQLAGTENVNFSAGVCRSRSAKTKRQSGHSNRGADILIQDKGRKTLGVRGKIRF